MQTSTLPSGSETAQMSLDKALSAIRQHLDMDVAYISRIEGNNSVFEVVDAPGLEALVKPGDQRSLDDVYCKHIVEGRLPELIADTSTIPFAANMPITKAVPIGSHMSIPIHLDNGDLYGMFCCLSARPNPSLNERDLNTMKMFAELAAEQVSDRVRDQREFATKSNAIRDTIDNDRFHLVFQPIVDLLSGEPIGYESLSRFVVEPYRPPNVWFDDAATVGIGTELECLAIEKALAEVCRLPDEMYASLNVSPETLLTERFHDIFADGGDLGRLMLEITEHSRVDNYQEVHQVLAPLRERGMKIAVDDAGAGYASLSHILQLQADVIKLDMGLVRDIDKDDARRALAAGMVMFASEMGIKVIAEGVETEAEKETLQSLGIFAGQGYLLGKPAKSRSTSSLSTH